MKKIGEAITFLIGIYILLMPILPSKISVKYIPVNGDVILLLVFCIFLISLIFDKTIRKKVLEIIRNLKSDYINISLIVLVLTMFISATYAFDKIMALKEASRYASYIILFFIVKYFINERIKLKRLLYCFIFTTATLYIIGIFQYIHNLINNNSILRIESTMENSNNFAIYILLSLFPIIILFLKEKNRKIKSFYGCFTLLAIINLFLTQSRNAILGLFAGLLFMSIIYSRRIIYLFAGTVISILFIPMTRNRLIQISDMSQNASRFKIWKTAYYMIRDYTIRGVGIGNFYTYYPKYINLHPELSNKYDRIQVLHPHNFFIKIQCEIGIAGIASIISFFVLIYVHIKKIINTEQDEFIKFFYTGFLASFVSVIFMNLFDNFFSAPKFTAFFFIITAIMENIKNSYKNI